ncbi:hypothetical protein K8353_48440, partial [Burkholderia contaminans]|nr:hypothetical protein [Burkholderia contaminans]
PDIFELHVIGPKHAECLPLHQGQGPSVSREKLDIRTLSSEEIQRKECFNSLNEPILQKIEKISDVLKDFEGQSLINIDRSWFYWDT